MWEGPFLLVLGLRRYVVLGPDRQGKIRWTRPDGTRAPGEPKALRLVDRPHIDSLGSGRPCSGACQEEVGSRHSGEGMNQTLTERILAGLVPYAGTPSIPNTLRTALYHRHSNDVLLKRLHKRRSNGPHSR